MRIAVVPVLAGFALAAQQAAPRAGAVHPVKPGDDPQAIADRAAPGDKIVFLPGLHSHPLRCHQSLLFVEKPLDIEVMTGATLQLAPGQTVLLPDPEITTDHGAPKTIDDLEVSGLYDVKQGPALYSIRIETEGKGGEADTFSWGAGGGTNASPQRNPITGGLQPLSRGVQIRFPNKTGHTAGSLWFVSYDGRESYGIRVGHGTQKEYIDGVRIHGHGTIDLNSGHNVQPSPMVKNISAAILVHGRVRNVSIEEVTMTNTMRSVMLYGEHTGKFLQGGGTEGGESFDAENISILFTRTINPHGAAYLLGHPSHRGRLRKVRCNFNYMESATTSLEPNFNLDQYEVIGNVIKSGGRAIHCWRKSTNGLIKDNVRIDDSTGLEVVMVNAPGAWEPPQNLVIRDNRNHLSEKTGFWSNVSGGLDNRAYGRVSTVDGGRNNLAAGLGSTVTGGEGNEAAADYSRVHGLAARSIRPGEDVLSAGSFQAAGDAQTSHFAARQVTTAEEPQALQLTGGSPITIPENATVSYRVLVAARSEGGNAVAAFEASGVASRIATGGVVLAGNTVRAIYKSNSSLDFNIAPDRRGNVLRLEARGLKGLVIRWVARVEIAEVRF